MKYNSAEFEAWRYGNKYANKSFSIIGDSISTLEGYNPQAFAVHYAGEVADMANVHEMDDTWWGKVINFFGGKLLVNNSWAGSTVARLPKSDKCFPAACSDERTGGLHTEYEIPDVILIYIGLNDWGFATPFSRSMSFFDPRTNMDVFGYGTDEYCFEYAYSLMLEKLKKNYPNAEIWCCTISTTYMSSEPDFVFPEKPTMEYTDDFLRERFELAEYNNSIKKVVEKHGCKLIDLYENNVPYDSIEGTHPNADGMNTLSAQIIRAMSDDKGASFLDCRDNHEFVCSECFCDATLYICRKCAMKKVKSEWGYRNIIHDLDYRYADDSQNNGESFLSFLKLFVVSTGENIYAYEEVVNLGKADDCNIQVNSPYASRQHARFYFEGCKWYIADTDSLNGVWVNGNKLEPKTKYCLSSNDEINIADVETFIFYKKIAEEEDVEKTIEL